MSSFYFHDQRDLNEARGLLRGKIIYDKYTEVKMSQNEKLLFCIKNRNNAAEIETILAGTHPRYRAMDKPGWTDGNCTNETEYEEYLKTC